MGLTQPTLGRHVDGLERALGLKLFTRSFDGFAPTDAALELEPYAAGLGSTAASLIRVLPRKFSVVLDTWVAMHGDLRGNPRCSMAFSALARGIAAYIKGP